MNDKSITKNCAMYDKCITKNCAMYDKCITKNCAMYDKCITKNCAMYDKCITKNCAMYDKCITKNCVKLGSIDHCGGSFCLYIYSISSLEENKIVHSTKRYSAQLRDFRLTYNSHLSGHGHLQAVRSIEYILYMVTVHTCKPLLQSGHKLSLFSTHSSNFLHPFPLAINVSY